MMILIVDDEFPNRLFIQRLLKDLGILDIKMAINGNEAVELCKQYDFDIIFMDVKMPIMNGVEATRIIKEIKEKTPHIVGVSSFPFEDIEKTYNEEPKFNGYIPKPINIGTLRQYLEKLKN
ncbi:TPA: response regulator [Patescibacteria group bacterium]|nr:PAS protein [candidate division SR1 bacterium RAAC1_SR1_1]HCY20961.1 response regulator [Candidatus Gracilibacteria bacterium]